MRVIINGREYEAEKFEGFTDKIRRFKSKAGPCPFCGKPMGEHGVFKSDIMCPGDLIVFQEDGEATVVNPEFIEAMG